MRDAIAAGRLRNLEEAVLKAMALWESRERARARLLSAIDDAEASLARCEGRVLTEDDMPDCVEKIHQRGLARSAEGRSSPV